MPHILFVPHPALSRLRKARAYIPILLHYRACLQEESELVVFFSCGVHFVLSQQVAYAAREDYRESFDGLVVTVEESRMIAASRNE